MLLCLGLGFIQILEREFKVDLHELREDYLSYTNGSRRINEKKSIPAKVSQTSTKKRVRDHSFTFNFIAQVPPWI